MALWTPADSTVQPILMIKDADAVWTGSALTSIINSGSDGGSWTVAGAPDKGTAINGLDPIRFDANTEVLQKTCDFPNSGKISVFTYGRLITAGVNGIVNRSWHTGTNRFVLYLNTSGASAGSCMLGVNAIGAFQAPSWENAADGQFQTAGSINSVYSQGGVVNDAWVDGVQKTLTGTSFSGAFPLAGAVPDYPLSTWEIGRGTGGGAPTETANWEGLVVAIFPDNLPLAELQKWEGYWHHRGGTSLPIGHPYRDNAPTTDNSSVGSASGVGSAVGVGLAVGVAVAVGSAAGIGGATAHPPSPGTSRGFGLLMMRASAGIAVSGTGSGSASGAGSGSATGRATAISAGAASGTGNALAAGVAPAQSVGAASAVGAATATGLAAVRVPGSAIGAVAASSAGSAAAVAAGSASASASSSGVGAAAAAAIGSAAGIASASSFPGGSQAGAAFGIGSASAVGAATALSVGAASAVASASGASVSATSAAGTGSATSPVLGIGIAVFVTEGQASASAGASGVGEAQIVLTGQGSAQASASGTLTAVAVSAGSAAGVGAAQAVGSGGGVPPISIDPLRTVSVGTQGRTVTVDAHDRTALAA